MKAGRVVLACLAGVFIAAIAVVHAASAGESGPATSPAPIVETVLNMEPVASIRISERGTAAVRLTTLDGEPIADAAVELYVDGLFARRTRTDADGRAALLLPTDLPVGDHELLVIYFGAPDRALRPVRSAERLEVRPATLEIDVAPPLPGVEFSLIPMNSLLSPWSDRSVTFASGSDGVARVDVDRPGMYLLRVHPWRSPDPTVRAEFARWKDDVFTPERSLKFKPEMRLQVGFERSYLVSQAFKDLEGQPVAAARISSFTLRSSIGQRISLEDGRPRWLKGGRISRKALGLEEVPIVYAVESVLLDGTNVVNRSQQAFVPRDQRSWEIEILLYKARFTGRDALFGVSVEGTVEVQYPNGTTRSVPLDPDGEVILESLPRGEYQVSIRGAGFSPPRPVTLTRDQEVNLDVITYLDMALIFGLIGTIGLGLLFIGRPQVLMWPIRFLRPVPRLVRRFPTQMAEKPDAESGRAYESVAVLHDEIRACLRHATTVADGAVRIVAELDVLKKRVSTAIAVYDTTAEGADTARVGLATASDGTAEPAIMATEQARQSITADAVASAAAPLQVVGARAPDIAEPFRVEATTEAASSAEGGIGP